MGLQINQAIINFMFILEKTASPVIDAGRKHPTAPPLEVNFDFQIAELQFIAFMYQPIDVLLHRLSIQECSISAAHIGYVDEIAATRNAHVLPRYARLFGIEFIETNVWQTARCGIANASDDETISYSQCQTLSFDVQRDDKLIHFCFPGVKCCKLGRFETHA